MALTGKVLFSSGFSVTFDIWSLDLESGALTQLTFGENLNDFPRWSPDGSKIAYICTESDSIPSLWIMNSGGGEKRRLTDNIYCQSPSWAPDGSTILFTGNAIDSNEIEVCTIRPDGSDLTRLFTHTGVEETPCYSPDGKKVVFSAPAAENGSTLSTRDSDIVEVTLATKSSRVLFSHPAKDYAPVYSPDGKKIAFISHRNDRSSVEYTEAYEEFKRVIVRGTNAEARAAMVRMKKFESDGDVFVANSDGSDLKQLTHDSRSDNGVCWSPCGNFLMYTTTKAGQHESERLVVIDAETGKGIRCTYDRTPLERDIGSSQLLNASFFQKLIPNFIERKFIDSSFWGEERHPHWIA